MLKRIRVKNYKSLADFEMELGRLNVLIGRNNAGKSNIFDCLIFLSEIITKGGLRHSLDKRGGFQKILFRGSEERRIGLYAEIELDGETYEYGVSFSEEVEEESLFLGNKALLKAKMGRGYGWDEVEGECKDFAFTPSYTAIFNLTDLRRHPQVKKVRDFADGFKLFCFSPSVMREFQVARRMIELDDKGRNLSSFFHTLYSEFPRRSFEEIKEILKIGIEGVEDLLSPITENGRTYIALKEEPFETPFDQSEVSDGIIMFLAYLGILFSPQPPTVGLFEEPENFVHPELLKILLETFEGMAERFQVLISTHSPLFIELIDPAKLPEQLMIVKKGEGRTTCVSGRVKKEIIQELRSQGITLSEIWTSRELEDVS